MTYYVTPYKNGLVNFPIDIRKKFEGKHIKIVMEDDKLILQAVDNKPTRVFEDTEGKIIEYENGDFDVEFKKGVTLDTFQQAVKELADEIV
jgi:hypothetical protein